MTAQYTVSKLEVTQGAWGRASKEPAEYPSMTTLEEIETVVDGFEERIAIVMEGERISESTAKQVVAEQYGYVSEEAFRYDIAVRRDEIEYHKSIENKKGY